MASVQTIYVIGSWARPEFSEARDWLRSNAHAIRFSNVETVVQAIDAAKQDPHQILFVQTRPGQFHQSDVNRLRTLAPLARISLLLGSWCEGETRSGFPLIDVPRLAWHNLRPRMNAMTHDVTLSSHSVLPFTTTEQDRCRFELRQCRPEVPLRIGVYSADPAQVAALCEMLVGNGHDPVRFTSSDQEFVDAIVWDDAGGARVPRIPARDISAAFGSAATTTVIALRTFARIQDVDDDRANGISATIAKPFQVADLFNQIAFFMPRAQRVVDAA